MYQIHVRCFSGIFERSSLDFSEISYWDRYTTQLNTNHIFHKFLDWTAEVNIRLSVAGLATALILPFFVDRQIILWTKKQYEGVTCNNTKAPVFDRHFVFLALIFPLLGIHEKGKELHARRIFNNLLCVRLFRLPFYFHINIVLFILTLHSIGWVLTLISEVVRRLHAVYRVWWIAFLSYPNFPYFFNFLKATYFTPIDCILFC